MVIGLIAIVATDWREGQTKAESDILTPLLPDNSITLVD